MHSISQATIECSPFVCIILTIIVKKTTVLVDKRRVPPLKANLIDKTKI